MNEKKCDLREAEVGGFWSTKNPNVFNGTVNGVEVLLIRNLNKNNNSKFPEFRLYSREEYSKIKMNIELDKKKTEQSIKKNKIEMEKITTDTDVLIELDDIVFEGDYWWIRLLLFLQKVNFIQKKK